MTNIVVELTEEEKAMLIKHLEGLSALYVRVNGRGDGPLSSLIMEIKSAQLVIEFDFIKVDSLLRHLEGASTYDKVVQGSDPLRPIIERIKRTRGY